MSETADQQIIGTLFDQFAKAEYPKLKKDDAFERFAVTQVLKPREISTDELEAGIVDASDDGGLDSFYVFVNGALLDVDDALLDPQSEAFKSLAKGPHVEVVVVQSKNKKSWEEAVWEKLLSTLPAVLDLQKSDAELEQLYNSKVVERTGILRRLLKSFAVKFPKVSLRICYVTKAPEINITGSIHARADQVSETVKSRLSAGSSISVEHVGAAGLYELTSQAYGEPASLTFFDLVRLESSYLGVATLEDYLAFVRKDDGTLREELFDANVRDFEGDNMVNRAITETLSTSDNVEFWWLNNGVTVLGDEVSGPQKSLTISRPLIVNGLQTSHVLHRAEVDGGVAPQRLANSIVVRVIVSTDENVRDRVIAGTNRQTPVPGPALFATDPKQIRLEAFLKTKGFYYERRKNRYKNLGKPANKRISMSMLAQAMITVLLGTPDAARARPSSILTRKGGYESIFAEDLDLDVYVRALQLLEHVDTFLKSSDAKAILDEQTNARFYVLAGYVMLRLRTRQFGRVNFDKSFAQLGGPADLAALMDSLVVLERTAKRFQRANPEMSRDSVFKSGDFRDKYFAAVGRSIAKAKNASK